MRRRALAAASRSCDIVISLIISSAVLRYCIHVVSEPFIMVSLHSYDSFDRAVAGLADNVGRVSN